MSFLDGLFGGNSASDIDWYCDSCDAYLNRQEGFTTDSGSWICTNCGAENDVTSDNIVNEEEDAFQASLQRECPKCGGHMARGQGYANSNIWVCEECGTEAEEDEYGVLWIED